MAIGLGLKSLYQNMQSLNKLVSVSFIYLCKIAVDSVIITSTSENGSSIIKVVFSINIKLISQKIDVFDHTFILYFVIIQY